MSERVFIVKTEPFIYHNINFQSTSLIHERELAKETDVFFSVKSTIEGFVEIFFRAHYIKFNTRFDALTHIERKASIQIELLERRLHELKLFQENLIIETKHHEQN